MTSKFYNAKPQGTPSASPGKTAVGWEASPFPMLSENPAGWQCRPWLCFLILRNCDVLGHRAEYSQLVGTWHWHEMEWSSLFSVHEVYGGRHHVGLRAEAKTSGLDWQAGAQVLSVKTVRLGQGTNLSTGAHPLSKESTRGILWEDIKRQSKMNSDLG